MRGVKDYPGVREAARRWVEAQDGQQILLTTPSVLVGFRVEVYRAEGTTQWYTAVICGYNEATHELTVTDDTVLEGHNEDPTLVQMRLIGDRAIFRTVHPKINRKDKARDSGPVTRGSDPRLSSKNATPFLIVVVLLPAYNTVVTFSDERNSGTFTGLAGARDRARHPGLRASSAAAYSTLNSHIRNRTNVTSCRVSFGLFRN
ncbi:hypothetical protein J6590_072005 [Homalodisca vitripennis]|nr:hypothetical protein J6590_072005 [Homalodisca vitripennis]